MSELPTMEVPNIIEKICSIQPPHQSQKFPHTEKMKYSFSTMQHSADTYSLIISGREVGLSELEEKRTKMQMMMTAMTIQASYQGYQPAPTGKVPNSTDTVATRSAYS